MFVRACRLHARATVVSDATRLCYIDRRRIPARRPCVRDNVVMSRRRERRARDDSPTVIGRPDGFRLTFRICVNRSTATRVIYDGGRSAFPFRRPAVPFSDVNASRDDDRFMLRSPPRSKNFRAPPIGRGVDKVITVYLRSSRLYAPPRGHYLLFVRARRTQRER